VIVLDLECAKAHQFEGWFASSEVFDQQCSQGLVSCPICGEQQVLRRPSAPHVARKVTGLITQQEASAPVDAPAVLNQLLEALRKHAEAADDVGERFAEEARNIHQGKTEARNIRGQTSIGEALDLLDEGIRILPIPATKEDLH
jgi:hypothetical protein